MACDKNFHKFSVFKVQGRGRVLGSWFLVLGSWFLVLGSWFLVLGSWFLVLGSLRFDTLPPLVDSFGWKENLWGWSWGDGVALWDRAGFFVRRPGRVC
jgi:hypothetical protein